MSLAKPPLSTFNADFGGAAVLSVNLFIHRNSFMIFSPPTISDDVSFIHARRYVPIRKIGISKVIIKVKDSHFNESFSL